MRNLWKNLKPSCPVSVRLQTDVHNIHTDPVGCSIPKVNLLHGSIPIYMYTHQYHRFNLDVIRRKIMKKGKRKKERGRCVRKRNKRKDKRNGM
jgi:hypothetical protein